jgi:3-oxoacyl-[acyl-carrier protein] reductase
MNTKQDTSSSKNNGKVAVVTGASRGIGAAIAKRLAGDGFTVVVNFAGRAADANAVVAAIKAEGGRAEAIQADVAVPAQVAALFDQTVNLFGGVDVVVNNAGILKLGAIAQSDDALFDQQIAVNLKGTFNALREAARRVRNGGRIVNFSTSVLGLHLENYGVYAATKAAVEALTPILAKELRGRAISVNAVAPGPTATDLFLDGKSPELIERMAKMNPLERLGTPDDIAAAVAFLAGPDGGWINGQVLRANGGMV